MQGYLPMELAYIIKDDYFLFFAKLVSHNPKKANIYRTIIAKDDQHAMALLKQVYTESNYRNISCNKYNADQKVHFFPFPAEILGIKEGVKINPANNLRYSAQRRYHDYTT